MRRVLFLVMIQLTLMVSKPNERARERERGNEFIRYDLNISLVRDTVSTVVNLFDKFSAKIVPHTVLNLTLRGICLPITNVVVTHQ